MTREPAGAAVWEAQRFSTGSGADGLVPALGQTTRAIRARGRGLHDLRIAQVPAALRPRQGNPRINTSTVKDALQFIHGEVDHRPIAM